MRTFLSEDVILIGERFSVNFQRTLRIPDDDQNYPLPAGLGRFPIHRVDEYEDQVPKNWKKKNGFFIPMYQREALWLGFNGVNWKPNAVKIGIGKVNVVSGEKWDELLHEEPQDYIVTPEQLWLDGINAGDNYVRQFVAMPLGMGFTVEVQITGKEQFGGIQLLVYEAKPGIFPDEPPTPEPQDSEVIGAQMSPPQEMGLGVGGRIKQKIYPDPYGIDTWDQEKTGDAYIYIVNSSQYSEITGLEPPATPIDMETYNKYGIPWFELYDEEKGDIKAANKFKRIKPIEKQGIEDE